METRVSAELQFAQKLASNEKKIRDRAIKRLNKYLSVRSKHGTSLSEPDLLKIWKGLFYCMWMQDKPLIQEELSQRITHLVHCFSKTEDALKFVKVFLETQSREWNGIDRLRLDKFLMMVRGMVHETFMLLSKDDWEEAHCRTFALSVYEHVMSAHEPRLPDGLKLHLADIFVDEMRKVSVEKLTNKTMLILLQPFIEFILFTNKIELARRVISAVISKAAKTISASRQGMKAEVDAAEDSDHVDEDMETDVSSPQEVVPPQSFKLDKRLLLQLMFEMAGQKVVRASNRALIYKFVKKRSKVFDSNANYITGSEQTSDSNLDGDGKPVEQSFVCDLRFLKYDGKAVDHQQRKKRKKGKNKSEEVNTATAVESVEALSDGNEMTSPTSKKKKGKSNNDENTSGSQQINAKKHKLKDKSPASGFNHDKKNKLVQTADSQTPVLSDIKSLGNKNSPKKLHLPSLINSPAVLVNSPNVVNRKRKFISESQELLPSKKKSKLNSTDSGNESISSPENNVVKSKKKKKDSPVTGKVINKLCEEITLDVDGGQSSGDTNSNARPKYRSSSPPKCSPAVSPVELVIYSHSSQSPSSLDHQNMTKSQILEAISPHPDMAMLPTSSAVAGLGRKRSKSESPKKPKLTEKKSPILSSGLIGFLSSALSAPFDTEEKDSGSIEAEEKSTPSGQTSKKKVIFDLRRNKANKFQDYLRSIAKQPEAPYEPTKSPAAGILKSPVNSPALSPSISEMSLSDSESKRPRSASKKALGSGRRQSAPGNLNHKPGGKKNKNLFKSSGYRQ